MVGLLVTLLLLIPVFGANPISGALIEIGFEGGHGTAGGMAPTFAKIGFQEGADLALGLATVGIIAGIVAGTVPRQPGGVVTAILSQSISVSRTVEGIPELSHTETPETKRRRANLMKGLMIDPLSINFGIVGGCNRCRLADSQWIGLV